MNTFLARVRNCHDDERLDKVLFDQVFRGFVHAPFHACKRRRRIENILAVLQIEHGITPSGETPIAARQINQDVTSVSEDLRRKSPVPR